MACGDTIVEGLLNASGMTVGDPCTLIWCSSDDVDEWNKQAWYVAKLVDEAFAILLLAEATNGLGNELSQAIRPTLFNYDLRMADVEGVGVAQGMVQYAFGGAGNSIEAINRDQQAIAVGACALEQVDVALAGLQSAGVPGIVRLPMVPPPKPPPEANSGWFGSIPWYAWAGAGVLLLGGVYLVGRLQ